MASSLTATVEKQEAMEGESTDQQVDPRVSGEAAAETSSTKMKDNETTGIVVSPDEETRKRKHAAVETTTDSDINPEAPPAGEDAPADGNTAAATNDETPPTEDAGTEPTQPAESKEAERKDSNATQTETEGDEKSKEPESSKEEQVKTDKEAVVEDNTEETEESDQKAAPKPPVLPPRPIKRARTAYFIFTDEKRPQVQSEVSTFIQSLCSVDPIRKMRTKGPCLFYLILVFVLCLPVASWGRCGYRRTDHGATVGDIDARREGKLPTKVGPRTGTSRQGTGRV